jgi:hypothetical protein
VGLAAGYTSNAFSAAPVDEQTEGTAASPVVAGNIAARAVLGSHAWIRPTLDARVRAEQLLRGVASDLSFRQLALRPGVLLGLQQPRLELRYAAEAVHWQGGDDYSSGPLWYSEAHRGEFEIDASQQLMAFGGAGYRLFRDRVRSRFEIDQGVAWGLPLSPTLDLTLGGSARWYRARAHAYTQLGATGLAQLDVSLPSRLLLRETGSVSGDLYPYSESYFPSAGDAQRQELLVRMMLGLWWPTGSPLRGAIEYSYTSRTSTASAYQFDDHRVLLRLRWSLDSDRFGNTVIPRAGRVPLETETGNVRSRESRATIRELMRQDEATQRGSSCLK